MPLLLSTKEWHRINKYLEKKDPGSRQRAYVKSLTKASAEMTKHWPNSLENVNKRNEEQRELRAKKSEQATTEFYNNYVTQRKEERKRMLAEARLHIFKDKDAPKTLLSGFLAANVQREWNRQRKFSKELAEEAKRKKDAYAAEQKKKYQEWKEEQRNKALKKQQNETEIGDFIKKQAQECKGKIEKARLDEVELERQDNITAELELAMFKEFEHKMKAKSQQNVRDVVNWTMDRKIHNAKEVKIREQLDDDLKDIYVNSKHRIDCIRKQKELQIRNEKLKILEQISGRLQHGTEERDRKEKEILDKAEGERLMREKERREADAANKARLLQELKDMHEECLQNQKKLKHQKSTLASWALVNRLKNEEKTKEFVKLEKEQKKKKILKHRDELIIQQNEKKQREAKEKAELRYFYGEHAISMLEKADKEFFAHADEVIKECIDTDRPPFPAEKVVDNYKRLYRLYPMPDVSRITRENYERSKKARAKVKEEAQEKQKKADSQHVPGPKDGIRNVNDIAVMTVKVQQCPFKQSWRLLPCAYAQPTKMTSGFGPPSHRSGMH